MVVEIDGSILEGGGQILRVSVALSILQCIPVRVKNIRAGRKKGGLAAQHLSGIQLARNLCDGSLDGDHLGSMEITLKPKVLRGGKFLADAKTAGSVALLLQVALPCAFYSNERTYLTLKGGTNAEMAPQIDYITEVLKPTLQKFGANFNCDITKRGFYPAGGGIVDVSIDPVKQLAPVDLTNFGEIKSIRGEAFVAGVLPVKIASEMAEAAENILKKSFSVPIKIGAKKFSQNEAFGNGSGINIVAETSTGCYLGGSELGKRGASNQEVGKKAAEALLESLKGKVCADKNLQDQLIIFMALAKGKSKIKVGEITLHTKTAIYIAELLTKAKFNIINQNDHNIIECDGIGLQGPII